MRKYGLLQEGVFSSEIILKLLEKSGTSGGGFPAFPGGLWSGGLWKRRIGRQLFCVSFFTACSFPDCTETRTYSPSPPARG